MNNLEKIQKGIKILQIITKIILLLTTLSTTLTLVILVLVKTNVLSMENKLFVLLSITSLLTKKQFISILLATIVSLLFSNIFIAFVYHYCCKELKEETPFTNTGAKRIRQIGIIQIVLSLLSGAITDGIYEKIDLKDWNRFDNTDNIIFGICLILISFAIYYGAELENKKS